MISLSHSKTQMIKLFIQNNVIPYYNNTHSNAFSGQMMNLFISKSNGLKSYAISSVMNNFSSHFDDDKSSSGSVLQRRVCYFANWVRIFQF